MTTNDFPSLRDARIRDVDLPRVIPSQVPSPQPSRPASVLMADEAPPRIAPPSKPRKPRPDQTPQRGIDTFWKSFTSKHPGKAYTILPDNFYAKRAAAHTSLSTTSSSRETPSGIYPPLSLDSPVSARGARNAVASYDEAQKACKKKVDKIVQECTRLNQKYRDPHFDIEADFKRWLQWGNPPDCLMGLADTGTELKPMSVKRVEDIFDQPRFFIEGASANDVRQGKEGDCWLMAALCILTNKKELIEQVCVARDEKVGVYGFVFHRDGEWISEIVDDKLYLIKEDYDESILERNKWLELQNRASPEEEYRTVMQTGSRALYFAQCSDANETWLPLLEKAYAKAHGDYAALQSGFVGEAIEDLTGGVTTELFSTDILDKDKFWNDELLNVNKQFLFGCGQMGGKYGQRKGILEKHAYSIMEAREINGERLLKLRNPWGNSEWTGAWSDGSAEWTSQWMEILDHKFGDDGVFWMSYRDLLRHYQHFDRTRLFGPEWTVTQQWTSFNVPWSVDYLETKFKVSLAKASHVVIVLSQLDDRYFRGLEGQYEFHLQFRVHAAGAEDYIVRSNTTYYMRRSVSTELNLDAGDYFILLKITAKRFPNDPTPEDIVRKTCHNRREKLLSIGLSYDLAHSKGQFRLLERMEKEKAMRDRRKKQKAVAKKMHEGRRLAHKMQKLKGIKTELRKKEKQTQRELRDIERHKAAVEAHRIAEEAARQHPDTETINRSFQSFSIGGRPGHGLGIVEEPPFTPDGVVSWSGSLPKAAVSSAPNPRHQSSLPASMNNEFSSSSRPATPPQSQRSPLGSTTKSRRHTDGPISRRGTLSPLPQVRISRPSIVEAMKKGKGLCLSDISDDDMSWDSELDGPEDSGSEAEPDGHQARDGLGGATGFFGIDREDPKAHKSDEGEEADPWNAVCVAGLRVFCEDKEREAEVRVEIVRPGDVRERDSQAALLRKGNAGGQSRLDVDDSAADAAGGVRTEMLSTYAAMDVGTIEVFHGGLPAHLESR